jgi:hypothetical protein
MGGVEKPKHERSITSISTHPDRPGADSAAPLQGELAGNTEEQGEGME